MKKVLNFIKKYNIYILVAILIVLVIIMFSNRNIKLKKFHNDYYSFKYSSNWKIKSNKKQETYLKSNKASLDIKVITLTDEYKYSKIDDILENLTYELNNQNKGYNLISQTKTNLTKSSYSGYKLLYEKDNNQAMINIIKSGDRVVVFIYESPNKYFDILLDSVQNIIYNFKLLPPKYTLETKIELDSKQMSFSKNQSLSKKLTKSSDYELYTNNYYVNYSLPSIIKRTTLNNTLGQFSYIDQKSEVRIVTSIYKINIYDYLDKDKSGITVYNDFKHIKENKDNNYSNYKEQLSKIKIDNYDSYIFKVTYTMKSYGSSDYEVYYLVIPLDKNHLFLIQITGKNAKVPKDLIDSIKINSTKHYASYIKKNIDNGNVKVELKRLIGLQEKEYETLEISIPEKYEEIDKNTNMYTNRYFGLNYYEEKDVYQYEIEYELTEEYTKEDSVISLANSSMSTYKTKANYREYSFVKEMTIDDKVYKVYEGGHTKVGSLYGNENDNIEFYVNKKLLFTELDKGGYFIIEISGNNTAIDDRMIVELAKYNMTREDYK